MKCRGLIIVGRLKGGFGSSYLHVRQPVVTFGFEALNLLGGVEGALRGMTLAAQAGAIVGGVDCGLDDRLSYICTRYTSEAILQRDRDWGRRKLGHFGRCTI